MNTIDDTSKQLGEYSVHEEHPSLLTVVIDTHPGAWAELESKLTLREAVASLLVFINGHMSLNNSNKVAVIASHTNGARFLYPLTSPSSNSDSSSSRIRNGKTMYRQFREIGDIVLTQLEKLLSEEQNLVGQSAISGALSLALTHINKAIEKSDDSRLSSRILLVSVSGELSSQYISTMNCIFAAQKRRIPIDVCKLAGDTVFLQQACDSTNGNYIKVDHPKGLVQYLMSAFFVEPTLRPHVNLGTQKEVDFRAACFVTKNVVDIGYVCSVCLCIMSVIPDGQCPHCETKYDSKDLNALNRKPIVVAKRKVKKKKKTDTPGSSVSAVNSPVNGGGTPASTASTGTA